MNAKLLKNYEIHKTRKFEILKFRVHKEDYFHLKYRLHSVIFCNFAERKHHRSKKASKAGKIRHLKLAIS